MTARTLMVQGTASSVGKSLLVTGLCRLFVQDGLRVAPFKSQNMALNAAVTPDGKEIGRAQAVQAAACRIPATVDMNPILLKPEADSRSQVVLLGEPIGGFSAVDYQVEKARLRGIVTESLGRLRAEHDLVIIEGAGSPAEVNLKERDLVNMFVAHAADAPVLLAGDIDRGGVFAAFVGTLELLSPEERKRVRGFIVNKFRGDVRLLEPGLRFLEEKTGIPVVGVIPWMPCLRIADEDSVSLDDRRNRPAKPGEVDIAVVRLPRISNYDDFQPLEHEPGTVVRFVDHPDDVGAPDLLVLPGTKSTLSDLDWLRQTGFSRLVESRAASGAPVLGICGGCQMLGRSVADHAGVETDRPGETPGLRLLPLVTTFGPRKRTTQVRARAARTTFLAEAGSVVLGYEIHMGRVTGEGVRHAPFTVEERNGAPELDSDGAVGSGGHVVGTMLHGLFENASVRRRLISELRTRRGLDPLPPAPEPAEDEFDRVARVVRENLRMDRVLPLIGR